MLCTLVIEAYIKLDYVLIHFPFFGVFVLEYNSINDYF